MRIIPAKLGKRARDAIQIVAPELLSDTDATLRALGWVQGRDRYGVFWTNPYRSTEEWSTARAIEIEGTHAALAYLEKRGWTCKGMDNFCRPETHDPLKKAKCTWTAAVQREHARTKEAISGSSDR